MLVDLAEGYPQINKKREATKAGLPCPYNDQILSPHQLFQFIAANLMGINREFVDSEEWNEEEQILLNRIATAKTIGGTQKLHYFMPISRSSLCVKGYSGSSTYRDVSIRKGGREVLEDNQIRGYIAVKYDRKWWCSHQNRTTGGIKRIYLHHAKQPRRKQSNCNSLLTDDDDDTNDGSLLRKSYESYY